MGDSRALGAGDCEAWRPTGLGQPTNTVTAAAYIVAGTWLLARARRVTSTDRWRARTYGTTLCGVGIGSIAYHGRGGAFAHWLHDGALAALVAALPIEQLATVRGWDGRRATSALLLGSGPALVHLALDPQASTRSTGVLVAAAAIGEADRGRWHRLALPSRQQAKGRTRAVTALAAVTGGVASYILGRTTSRACRPRSRWQWHGLWHVLGALAAAAWSDRVHVLPYLEDDASD